MFQNPFGLFVTRNFWANFFIIPNKYIFFLIMDWIEILQDFVRGLILYHVKISNQFNIEKVLQ